MTCRISNSVKFAILAWQQLLQIIIQVAEIIGQLLGFYTAIHCLYHIRPFMLIREAFKKKKTKKIWKFSKLSGAPIVWKSPKTNETNK